MDDPILKSCVILSHPGQNGRCLSDLKILSFHSHKADWRYNLALFLLFRV